ncbi:nuclear transport factor 2 family protein [Rhizobium sp. BK251]|uniref:nuclear transport factor 2 family protein n=1 Tax=Rhizobium sp. BK251 TaxID=2512125 RepID=UPI00104658E2|nr:nuclear transport factor 2 family protein [Rhizobium sp. BK251]TCL73703.1 hypothetical protein EV286_103235 [Rhizobium sp. BK251]
MKTMIAALAAATLLAFSPAVAADETLFPRIADTSKAAPETAKFFDAFFTAKSRHDVDATMSFFSPDLVTYTDAILGWPLDNYETLKGVFASYMPNWGNGRSYPFRIIGGPDSAVVAFIDTPELFGGEIRLLGAIDFKDGKIVRWVDYWDSTGFPADVYNKVRTPADKFPTGFKESAIRDNAAPAIVKVATDVQKALANGDAEAVGTHLSYDVVYEDLTLRTQILGEAATRRYLNRILPAVPFGRGAELMHVVGGEKGGGFEWRSADGKIRGVTAIELDGNGLVSRITTTYDGRLVPADARKQLVALSSEP